MLPPQIYLPVRSLSEITTLMKRWQIYDQKPRENTDSRNRSTGHLKIGVEMVVL